METPHDEELRPPAKSQHRLASHVSESSWKQLLCWEPWLHHLIGCLTGSSRLTPRGAGPPLGEE
ncbi:hypothetical protein TM01_09140 [Campylobacter jejuni subsp. jejuni]|nr:hypothetical protein TM01_09140 [Campylobacter jejuni subsp. jejuni]